MGKSKKSSSKAAAAAPKCLCDHPFKCDCGNRPERPSRGHKWDPETQAWGGKGHKQKGASGQTSQVAEAAKVTSVGKTQIAQWQRLPSTLLKEFCKRDKRKPPKFKNISKQNGTYLCRVILPDNKDPDKDLFFVPAGKGVDNEEQANEEACILALLTLTPTLPHERKLPEPYKTTWLHAIENVKAAQNKKTNTTKKDEKKLESTATAGTNSNNNNNNSNKGGGAQASTSLTLGKTYTSKIDKQRQLDDKRRERNKRIRQHEAVRMANKNHPVFLAAHLRLHIQKLLRGDTSDLPDLMLEDDDNDNDEEESPENDGEVYVLERLRNEGFTKRQVRTALQSIHEGNNGSDLFVSEDKWDALYEECLQWLCIHLDEDQLPEGFDPRGGTLDVIVPGKAATTENQSTGQPQDGNGDAPQVGKEVSEFASQYGISNKEAKLLTEQATKENCDPESMLWKVLQKAAGTTLESSAEHSEDNEEALNEEIEALEAIYPAEFQQKKDGNLTILAIKVTDVDTEMTLQAVVETGKYPLAYPKRLLLHGKWPKSSLFGAVLHVETIKFMKTLDLGNPMLFAIYGEVQTLFHSISSGDLLPLSLMPALGVDEPSSKSNRTQASSKTETTQQDGKGNARQESRTTTSAPRKIIRRPRQRSTFWSTHPSKTPFATAFPKIDNAMDRARKSLPAFKARQDFLAAMSKADKVCTKSLHFYNDISCSMKCTVEQPSYLLYSSCEQTGWSCCTCYR